MEIKRNKEKTLCLVGKKESLTVDGVARGGPRVALWTENKEVSMYGDDNLAINVVGPGEYEVGGVEIEGIKLGQSTFYVVNIDRVLVGVMGPGSDAPTEKKADRINELDVLIFYLDGTMNYETVVALAKKWGVNYLVALMGDSDEKLAKFLDQVDEEGLTRSDSLKVDRDDLPDGMEVTVL